MPQMKSSELSGQLAQYPDMHVYIQEVVEGESYYYPVGNVVVKERHNGEQVLIIESRAIWPRVVMKEVERSDDE